MKERPILFNASMVRAILDGQKSQTRRIVKPQPDHRTTRVSICRDQWMGNGPSGNGVGTAQWDPWRKSPFAAGDRLWVRETWGDVNNYGAPAIAYRADGDLMDLMECDSFLCDDGSFDYEAERIKPYSFCVWASDLIGEIEGSWRPSIHMPRWASRILLDIVSVRVERLNDCSVKDAIAEGAAPILPDPVISQVCPEDYLAGYRQLWEQINGAGSWAANPWVWVVEFKRIDGAAA